MSRFSTEHITETNKPQELGKKTNLKTSAKEFSLIPEATGSDFLCSASFRFLHSNQNQVTETTTKP